MKTEEINLNGAESSGSEGKGWGLLKKRFRKGKKGKRKKKELSGSQSTKLTLPSQIPLEMDEVLTSYLQEETSGRLPLADKEYPPVNKEDPTLIRQNFYKTHFHRTTGFEGKIKDQFRQLKMQTKGTPVYYRKNQTSKSAKAPYDEFHLENEHELDNSLDDRVAKILKQCNEPRFQQ
jgi:hypothetical protein